MKKLTRKDILCRQIYLKFREDEYLWHHLNYSCVQNKIQKSSKKEGNKAKEKEFTRDVLIRHDFNTHNLNSNSLFLFYT